jgi:uncharacterized protein (DUF736 family)
MSNFDNTNSGMLAKNDRKEKDTHPDYRGVINVDGVDYWLSAWIKVGRDGSKMQGQKYFSLAVKAKDEQQAKPSSKPQKTQEPDFPDEDLPF